MWHDHPFSQRKKATKRALKVEVGCKWGLNKIWKKGGRQFRGHLHEIGGGGLGTMLWKIDFIFSRFFISNHLLAWRPDFPVYELIVAMFQISLTYKPHLKYSEIFLFTVLEILCREWIKAGLSIKAGLDVRILLQQLLSLPWCQMFRFFNMYNLQ